MNLYLLVLTPVVAASISYLVKGKTAKRGVLLVQFLMVVAACFNFYLVRAQGEHLQNLGGWPPYIGITLRADILSSVMILLTAILFLAMILFDYQKEYINPLFHFLFLVLEGLIIGIFLSNDLFNIFVLVELSTVLISILIMFKRDSQAIYDGLLYLLMNVVAMSFFLFGLGILYKMIGMVDLYGIHDQIKYIHQTKALVVPFVFIITAVCLKSAMFPLFGWLPKAHGTPSAPGVVSALLSGLYVKVGIYLFLRIQSVFHLYLPVENYFLIIGFVTAVIGFILALSQKDIKLILAYHTISQVGLIMMALNMGSEQAYWGGIYHIINHAFFKSTLFLTAGLIIDTYKTRDIYKISGVFYRMPYISIATVFAIMGITGAPFFNGSISKYWISYGAKDSLAEAGLLLVNLGTTLSFVKYSRIFFGRDGGQKMQVDPYSNWVVLVMGTMCFFGGIFGQYFIQFLFGQQLLIDPMSYLIKVIYYIGTFLAGLFLYHGFIKRTTFLYRLSELEISFNGMCLAISFFFGFTLLYLRLMYH